LNRFCVQAVAGIPLTPYGKGRQTRGFLNIRDTLQCVELACLNSPEKGEYRVFNQFTEQFNVTQLAEMVKKAGEGMGYKLSISNIENPRIEQEEHYYNAKNTKLTDLGLQPRLLSEDLVDSMLTAIQKHRDRINMDVIKPTVKWA